MSAISEWDLNVVDAYFSVLTEHGIEQKEICLRTTILNAYDPHKYKTVDDGNLSRFKHGDRNLRISTLETLIAALLFEPTTAAYHRFFELYNGSFDLAVATKARRNWDNLE